MKSITKAFTLIELLIVIVIIGILAVALIPRLTGAQARARDTARIADLRQIQTAFALYSGENKGYPLLQPSCIGLNDGEKCRPGYVRNAGGSGVGGSTTLTNLLKPYMNTLPTDPLPTRDYGDRYIYFNSIVTSIAIGCNSSGNVINKPFLARYPEKVSGLNNETCAPGKFACCGPGDLGCGPSFCVLQLE